MDTTLDDIAAAVGVPALQPEEIRLLLDATREVAHTSERRYAPLAAFLLGVAVAGSDRRPDDVGDAISRLRAVLPAHDPPAS